MAFQYNPKIVTDRLVLCLDAANTKSLADVPSTNLFRFSQRFENWNQYQSTVSTNTTPAPDGTITADTNIETSGLTGSRGVQQMFTGMTSGQTYTFSVYAKNYNGRNLQMAVYEYPGYGNWFTSNFYLQSGITTTFSSFGSGVRTNTSMVNVGDGWYRCSISGYITGATQLQPNINFLNSANTTSYTGDGVSGVYLWGGQFEIGPVATTYIPTTTAAASRTPTWVDLSRGGNNGTLTNGLTYNYSNGGSLVFNGIDNYVDIPTSASLEITSDLTINVWIYNTLSKSGIGIVTKGPLSGDYDYMLYLSLNSTLLNFWKKNSSGVVENGGDFITTILNTWVNVCFTKQGTSIKAYENGVLRSSSTFTDSSIRTSSNSLKIGNGWAPAFGGNIPQVQIYNRALSAAEVLQNYNATRTRYGL